MRETQENQHPVHVELKPDRNLLDPNFDGYKLSLEKLPTYVVSIKTGVDIAKPSEQQYSLQHVKHFAIHNHIFSDSFNPFVFYIVDKLWTVLRGSIDFSTGRLDVISELWRIPKPKPIKEGRYNITLSFPDEKHAVVSDGCETIYIVKTGDRKSSEPWNPITTLTPFKGKVSPQCSILDSISYKNGNEAFIDVLAVRIDDKNEWNECIDKHPDTSLSGHLFLTVLEWFTFQGEGVEETKWSVKSQRTLIGHSGTEYAHLEPGGSGLYISSDSRFHVVIDTENPIDWNSLKNGRNTLASDRKPEYVWTQTMEEIKLWFKVPFTINKKDVELEFKRDTISVVYKGRPIFEGPLTKPSKVEGSYWIIETPKCLPNSTPEMDTIGDNSSPNKYKVLEIVLEKGEHGSVWADEVIKGIKSPGQEVSDPEFLEQIHSRLAHLCSDKWGVDPEPSDIFDPRQLEECDDYPADSSCFMRVDRSLQIISHVASLGSHQWLFNVRVDSNKPPAMCIRHDVDGIVWMPSLKSSSVSSSDPGTSNSEPVDERKRNVNWLCEHIGTFSALGYVQASKQQRKFKLCSSGSGNISYVSIFDVKKHIYVYRQPAKIDSCLRNRKTGAHVTHVAKQVVISLDPPQDILGGYATLS